MARTQSILPSMQTQYTRTSELIFFKLKYMYNPLVSKKVLHLRWIFCNFLL